MTNIPSLMAAAEKRNQALSDYDSAMLDLRKLVVEAHENGFSVAGIAKAADITRQTVYTILKDQS